MTARGRAPEDSETRKFCRSVMAKWSKSSAISAGQCRIPRSRAGLSIRPTCRRPLAENSPGGATAVGLYASGLKKMARPGLGYFVVTGSCLHSGSAEGSRVHSGSTSPSLADGGLQGTAAYPAIPRRAGRTLQFPACQGWGRGFESLRPLQFSQREETAEDHGFAGICATRRCSFRERLKALEEWRLPTGYKFACGVVGADGRPFRLLRRR